jgi:hypothetical protein
LGKRKQELRLADVLGEDDVMAVQKGLYNSENKWKRDKKSTDLPIREALHGQMKNELNKRVGKATLFCHLIKSILWNKDIERVNTIYRMYFKEMLLYGVKTWTCTKRVESKIQTAKIKFLKAIIGKTKTNGIRNTHFRGLRMEDVRNQLQENI